MEKTKKEEDELKARKKTDNIQLDVVMAIKMRDVKTQQKMISEIVNVSFTWESKTGDMHPKDAPVLHAGLTDPEKSAFLLAYALLSNLASAVKPDLVMSGDDGLDDELGDTLGDD